MAITGLTAATVSDRERGISIRYVPTLLAVVSHCVVLAVQTHSPAREFPGCVDTLSLCQLAVLAAAGVLHTVAGLAEGGSCRERTHPWLLVVQRQTSLALIASSVVLTSALVRSGCYVAAGSVSVASAATEHFHFGERVVPLLGRAQLAAEPAKNKSNVRDPYEVQSGTANCAPRE